MKAVIHAWVAVILPLLSQSYAQQTVQIGFDGPPLIAPGTARFVQQYFDSGIWLRPIGEVAPGRGFVHGRGGGTLDFPDNGTAYLAAVGRGFLVFSFTDGSVFDLVSVDLAEYSTLFAKPLTVHFIGYRPDGSTVTTNMITDGVIDGAGPLVDFETFYFDSNWTGLERVEIPTYGWSLDNLIIVPEPTIPALLLLAGMVLGGWKWRNRASQ